MVAVPFTVLRLIEMTISITFISWVIYPLHLACLKRLIRTSSAREFYPVALRKLINVLWDPFPAIPAEVPAITSVS